jgi:hypothetical protein
MTPARIVWAVSAKCPVVAFLGLAELALLMVIVDVHFWPIFEGQCSSTGDVVVVPDMQIWEARG